MRPCIIFYRNDEDDVRGLLRLMGHVRFAYKWKDPMLLHFMFQVVCIVSNHVTTISQMFVKSCGLIGHSILFLAFLVLLLVEMQSYLILRTEWSWQSCYSLYFGHFDTNGWNCFERGRLRSTWGCWSWCG